MTLLFDSSRGTSGFGTADVPRDSDHRHDRPRRSRFPQRDAPKIRSHERTGSPNGASRLVRTTANCARQRAASSYGTRRALMLADEGANEHGSCHHPLASQLACPRMLNCLAELRSASEAARLRRTLVRKVASTRQRRACFVRAFLIADHARFSPLARRVRHNSCAARGRTPLPQLSLRPVHHTFARRASRSRCRT